MYHSKPAAVCAGLDILNVESKLGIIGGWIDSARNVDWFAYPTIRRPCQCPDGVIRGVISVDTIALRWDMCTSRFSNTNIPGRMNPHVHWCSEMGKKCTSTLVGVLSHAVTTSQQYQPGNEFTSENIKARGEEPTQRLIQNNVKFYSTKLL